VTTSKKKVRFWENHMQDNCSLNGKDISKIKGETLVSYEPIMIKKDDFGKDKESNRLFVQSEFLPEESSLQAVSATVDGQLIMWDMSLILEESSNVRNRREVKSINLLSSFNKRNDNKEEISNMLVHERLIIIGTTSGSIRFYDFRFRILCWFENIGLACVTSISFAKIKFDYEGFWRNHSENSELKENKEYNFEYIDFVVADSHARVHLVQCSLFSEIQSANRKGRLLLEGLHHPVEALVHETSSGNGENKVEDLVLSCRDGKIYRWPVKSPFLKVIKHFREEGEYATCLAFSPKNQEYLVAGTNKGNILVKAKSEEVFGSTALVISQKRKEVCSKKIRFSEDGQNFAIMDNCMCVSLFKLGHKYDDPTREIQWVFSGKIQAHSGRIRDIQFVQRRMWINDKENSGGYIKVKVIRKGQRERIRIVVLD
jgi:hypothetical protein